MQTLIVMAMMTATMMIATMSSPLARASPLDGQLDEDRPREDGPRDGRPENGPPGVAVRASVPHVNRVLEAAYRAAGLHRDVGRGFARRARLAGLVPWLSVRTARGTNWHDLEQDVGRSSTIEVRATWRLDRLVFEPRELQISTLEATRRRERRRLAQHVIRAYFAWRHAASDARAEAAAAELDELTDGWFTEAARR